MENEPMSSPAAGPSWKGAFEDALALFGHRNWIVVADSAYPAQSRAGITTILAGASLLDVLEPVLAAIQAADHVKARIYIDRELDFVTEGDAPGVSAFRAQLATLPHFEEICALPHEEIIARLDSVAQTFSVLILKSSLAIPYTSVFLELDCAYWSTEAESRLRAAMRNESPAEPAAKAESA
jgi:hypothetical protein